MTNSTTATTRGYDEFIPKQACVVTERRQYSNYPSDNHERYKKNSSSPSEIEIVINFSIEGTQKINTVDVKGEWDNWEKFYQLERTSEYNFEIVMKFSRELIGRELAYKFVLDKKQ